MIQKRICTALISGFLVISGFLLPLLILNPVPVSAGLSDLACDGLQSATGEDCGGGSDDDISGAIRAAINILSILVGIAAVIMIIIAGIRYITAGGDPGSIKGARDTVIYAIVGLLVAAAAQAIVRFVLSALDN